MIRQLLWFVLGWGGPVPLHTYSGIEYLIAFGGGGVAVSLYPVWFRMGFSVAQRGKQARIGAWAVAVVLAVAWCLLALDLLLFNLQDALSWRFAAAVLAQWPFTQAPHEDHVRLVERDIEAWRLKPAQLEADLLQDDAGISHLQRLCERQEDAFTAKDKTYLRALQKRPGLTEQQAQAVEALVTAGGNTP